MKLGCVAIRRQIGPFVDGELRGAQMLVVAQHLDDCTECATEVGAIRRVGDALRGQARDTAGSPELAGLAASVVSLSRAETALSWRGRIDRATESWHWAVVGLGSVAATCVSTVLVSAILAFGPAPERDDSLAALISNLQQPTPLFVFATSVDEVQDAVCVRVDVNRPASNGSGSNSCRRSEADLVSELADSVTRDGRVVTLIGLGSADRPKVEALLEDISRRHTMRPVPDSVPATFNVREVRLVASVQATP